MTALLTAAPAQSMQPSPLCENLSQIIFNLAEAQDTKSKLLGTIFFFEFQILISPDDAKCIDYLLQGMSKGKYKFTPRFDHKKGYYFEIEKSPQYIA